MQSFFIISLPLVEPASHPWLERIIPIGAGIRCSVVIKAVSVGDPLPNPGIGVAECGENMASYLNGFK
ncbi:MAG: hypothetical protein ABW095_09525 [Candidatus Thiodiazotropha sp.]